VRCDYWLWANEKLATSRWTGTKSHKPEINVLQLTFYIRNDTRVPLQRLEECVQFKRTIILSWRQFFQWLSPPYDRGNSVSIVTGYAPDERGSIPGEADMILFATASKGREADHSLPSSAEVELYLHFLIRLHGVMLLHCKYDEFCMCNYGNLFWQRGLTFEFHIGLTQPPIQWVPEVLSPGLKRGRGVTLTTHPHLVPRLCMSRSYTSSPPMCHHGI
jgi:hypothetical protein